jgi:PAS domain S-box-containing protein
MRIKTKLQIATVLSLTVVLVIGSILFFSAQQVNKAIKKNKAADEIIKGLFELNILTNYYLIYHEERAKTQWKLKHNSLRKLLKQEEFKGLEEMIYLKRMRKSHEDMKTTFSQMVSNYEGYGDEKGRISQELNEMLMGNMDEKSRSVVSDAYQLAEISSARVAVAQQRACLLVVLLALMMAVVIAAVSLLINRGVVKPIRKLHEGTEIIGADNLNYKVGTIAKDEVGQLSRAFEQMTVRLKESFAGLEKEIAERKQAEERILKLNRVYAVLSEINQAIVRLRDTDTLFKETCRIAVEDGGFRMAWIGLVNESSQKIQVVAYAGKSDDYLEKINISLKDEPLRYCPIDSALRESEHIICNAIGQDEYLAACQKIALELGFPSSVSFPLRVFERIQGTINFCAGEPHFFDEEELRLLDELARDISFAMEFAEQEAQRKQAEAALRSSERKYRTLIENLPQKIFLKDKNSIYISCNDNYAQDLKIKPDGISGRTDFDFYPKELAGKYRADDRRIVEIGKTEELEEKYIQNEQEVWVNTIKTPVKDEKGNLIGLLGIFWDITDRKRAEESLRQSEENARQLAQENAIMAEIGRIITSTLNIDEVYENFSEEVKKIIPFDRIVINIIDTEKKTVRNVYIAGKGLQDRNVKDVYPLEGSGNAEMVNTKSTLLIQTEDFNAYKDRFPMLLSTFQSGFRSIMNVPLFSKGKVIGGLLLRSYKPYVYTDKDVRLAERIGSQIAGAVVNAQLYTERIQAEKEKSALEEQLRQSQKMEAIGRLAGGVAHDFNNLLTIIKGNSQLSLMELNEKSSLRENLEEVMKASDRASDLIHQLLAFSRRQILELKVLDLNTVLQNIDKMLHRVIGEDIELVTQCAEDLGRVKTDSGQIEQVIMNLAVNARDAMPSGGRLIIETANVELDEGYARKHVAVKRGHYVMLSVSDTGAGMTPEVRDRVFEPFFTTKENGKGTGLGLPTVYGIVKQSGGNIWVYSEPGIGTTFKIYLPRVDEPLEEVMKERVAEEELPRGGETILVVEDDEDVRKLAVRILRMQGYRVLETFQGSDALLHCEQDADPIHLMVTDVVMPGMNGPELAKRLKPIRPEMKVLYISGYTDNTIAHHGVLKAGVNYIQKPFTVDGLTKKVREVLDKNSK